MLKFKSLLLTVVTFSLFSCSALNIGHNDFYCAEEENKCTNASSFLAQHNKIIDVKAYNELTQEFLVANPKILNHDNLLTSYLKIYFAPHLFQGQVYSQQYIYLPYIH